EALLTHAQSVNVLPVFSFTLLYNKGAAFRFLSDQAGWQRWFFILLALGVSAVLIAWLRRLKREERWTAVALALIIGGALGNVIDRILFGQVIDFLHFHYGNHDFPAFNIADSAITVGVAIMLLDALVLSRRRS
ncbi:MAG: signal peptidase II, partial [Candidatus Thiodiazotropha sp.]